MQPSHRERVREIYLEGIETGLATFETSAPEWEAWDRAHFARPRLVALSGDDVAGWAALSPVSSRAVYSGVAEVSIYVAANARGRGAGKQLLGALVAGSEEEGFWTLQAGILARNLVSITLHLACGFREVGVRERIGRLRGAWEDVVLMERRSPRID
ncbi:MAG TPA: GNAT family N-acetyltransferase [Thermoanaerobaculia bacterium]|nr:GNAT family N-acetyltransferase [Thermoanaerobaculia bacterium]